MEGGGGGWRTCRAEAASHRTAASSPCRRRASRERAAEPKASSDLGVAVSALATSTRISSGQSSRRLLDSAASSASSITQRALVLGFLPPPHPGWLGSEQGGAKRGQVPRAKPRVIIYERGGIFLSPNAHAPLT